MNKKKLAVFLSKLKNVVDPKIHLEQYQTDSEIAADILWIAYLNNDINEKVIADFGCGNGIFGIGSLLLGAKKVYFVDTDKNSILILRQNLRAMLGKYKVLSIDIKKFNKKVDTVIQNPPFGVQRLHADRLFLEKSFEIADTIYSLHKLESKLFISKFAEENGFKIYGLKKYNFPLKNTMFFHKENKHMLNVGCWILKR